MKYTYLMIDFFSVLVPFVFSFHPKINFYRNWASLFPAIFFTGLIFLIWDALFTKMGVWGFNPPYLMGVTLYNLPLEEVLFFICIPYACIFAYHCLELHLPALPFAERLFTPFLIVTAAVLGAIWHNKYYTACTFFSLAFALAVIRYAFGANWLGRFYQIYLVLLIPFMIVNGLLTGTGLKSAVVWYNNAENLKLRILTIPVEDVFYGMALIIINLTIYKGLLKKRRASCEVAL